LGRLAEEAGEAEVTDFQEAGWGEQDVGWFEVAVKDVRGVQKVAGGEELVQKGADYGWWDCPRMAWRDW